ncbi:MAG TPA: peptide-methionine (S)-S-oxide reductase MsrA [Gemmatimonadaceae bacterium]
MPNTSTASNKPDIPSTPTNEVATLAGGCYWCLDAAFRQLRGIVEIESGFSGGHVANPTYEQVCTGTTGHAEVVRVTFDPSVISYRDLLTVFFTIHDPTTLNRQGPDVGEQYRSVIFYHTPEQRAEAEGLMAELQAQHLWSDPVVTEILPAPAFYPAHLQHQDYYTNNPRQPYCQAVVAPKIAKVRKAFFERLAS